jgi:predicted kinase
VDALILVGPNGVGKSTVGRALASTGRFEYLDLEAFFVRRYGSLEAYRIERERAYDQFEASVREAIACGRLPIVFEEVGLNESAIAMLAALRRDYHIVVIELIARVDVCIQRAVQRKGGDRFPKTTGSVGDVWERFALARTRIGPIQESVDTEAQEVSSIVTRILHCVDLP